MRESTENIIVDVNTLAKVFKRDERTIQLWVEDGMPREGRGKYDLLKCYEWRLNKLEKENDILKNSGDETRYQIQMEGDKIKNKLIETKWKREIGTLVRKQDVLVAWGNQNNIIGTKLEHFKDDLYRALSNAIPKDMRKKIHGIIVKEVNIVKKYISKLELAKYIEDEEKIIEDAEEINGEN